MLKKLLFMIICCLMLTACGGEETKNDVNELKPLYSGFFFWGF